MRRDKVVENLFTFSISIALVQKTEIEILMDLHVLSITESKKVIFGMSSVCVSVCLCVCLCTLYLKK